MQDDAGFSLVELMVTITIIAVLVVVGVPAVLSWLPSYRLKAASADMMANFQKAKITAIKNGVNCGVVFTQSGGSFNGYTIFQDSDADFSHTDESSGNIVDEVPISEYPDISITSVSFDNSGPTGNPCIAFRSNGIPADANGGTANGTVTFQNTKGLSTQVIINISGNIRVN